MPKQDVQRGPSWRESEFAAWSRRGVILAAASVGAVRAQAARAQETMSSRDLIPFWFLQDSSVVIKASVGGTPAAVLIDTGAATTLVSARLADRLGWASGAGQMLRGNAGRAAARQGEPLTLQIGSNTLTTPTSVVLDLDLISSSMGLPIDIVIGRHLFDGTVVEVDFPGRRLAIGADLWTTRGSGLDLPIGRGQHGERVVQLSIEGRAPIAAVFDLGSSSALMLAPAYAGQVELLKGRRTSTAAIGGVDGVQISTAVVVDRLDFAGGAFRNLPAEVLPQWVEPAIPANLGLPVLSRFRLVCDFAHDRVHLELPPALAKAPFARDHSGLGIAVHGDYLEVVHVAANSPAAAGAWRIGDVIISIDGQTISPDYITGELWAWRNWAPGRRVRLGLRSGGARDLTLADYY